MNDKKLNPEKEPFSAFTYRQVEEGYHDIRDTNLVLIKGDTKMILGMEEIKQIEKAIGAKFKL